MESKQFNINEKSYLELFKLSKEDRANVYDAILLKFFSEMESEGLNAKEMSAYKNILNSNKRKVVKGKHLFANSPYFTDDTDSTKGKKLYLKEISEKFKGSEFKIDFGHYWYSMRDWSEQKGEKRTNWVSVASSWIRRDMSENKLVVKKDNKVIPHDNHR